MAKVTLVLEDSKEGLAMDLVSDPELPTDLNQASELTAAQFLGLQAHRFLEETIGSLSNGHNCDCGSAECSEEESSIIIGADKIKKDN